MFNAKNMIKRTNKFNKKYQKWVLRHIKKNINEAAMIGDDWIFVDKRNNNIDEDLANEIVKYFNRHGFKADNHEGYSYIDISWGE